MITINSLNNKQGALKTGQFLVKCYLRLHRQQTSNPQEKNVEENSEQNCGSEAETKDKEFFQKNKKWFYADKPISMQQQIHREEKRKTGKIKLNNHQKSQTLKAGYIPSKST